MATDIYDIQETLWAIADELRANSNLSSSEYSTPVLGLIFLKFADDRFDEARVELEGSVEEVVISRAIAEDRLCYYVVDDPVNGPREIHKDNPRIICTNHNGGITVESTIRLDQMTFEQVSDAIGGRQPDHVLNPEVLDHPRVRWISDRMS